MILLFSVSNRAHTLDLTKLDISFQYDVNIETNVEYRIVDVGNDQLKLIFQVENAPASLWRQNILGQNGYASETHDTLSLAQMDTLLVDEDKGIYSFVFPKNKYNLLIISIYNLSEGFYRIHDVSLNAPGGYPEFYPVDENGVPILSTFTTDDQLSFVGIDTDIHVFQYEEAFGPADPPMGQMSTLAPTLAIDSAYFIDNELSDLQDYHFYLFQRDTLDNTGITILKCPYYYPDLRTFEELIKPMRYISTSSENESLNQTSDPRKAFENFWLSNYGTKFRARSAIRFFFQRVEEANLLFTDYKMGWKTDRGILYIIYGKPDVVIKKDREEEWRYDTGESFEFIRIPILFTPSLYSLRRDKEYEQSWYSQVGSIRKGQ